MTSEREGIERDFYRRLLDLGGQDELEPLLASALSLIVEVTGATVAYLELTDDEGDQPTFWKGHRVSAAELSTIRASISRGIIARAIAEGRTMMTASALDDDRFAAQGSVRQHEIQAVLCAPIGTPPVGVIYLQGCARPGGFSVDDRTRAELFARQLAPLTDRLRTRLPSAGRVDHTREIRARFQCPQLVGTSPALAHVLQQAALVAPLDLDVLITGPAGTGKTALARAIADNSRRARGPFVAINCAAMQDTLIESELFGARKDAFTGATKDRRGKVAAADGGTLFLDEISELSPGAQAKLLHLLQAHEYHAVGATEPTKADVRIVSATNADLKQRVIDRQFREDLYYRLHVLPIAMPALAERRDDIPALVEHVAIETCRRHGFPALAVSHRTLLVCREAAWPGNVRELAHAVEAGVVRACGTGATVLQPHHMFPEVPPFGGGAHSAAPATLGEATREFQRRYLRECLEANDWNVAETHRQLDIARSHIYTLISAFGLTRDKKGK